MSENISKQVFLPLLHCTPDRVPSICCTSKTSCMSRVFLRQWIYFLKHWWKCICTKIWHLVVRTVGALLSMSPCIRYRWRQMVTQLPILPLKLQIESQSSKVDACRRYLRDFCGLWRASCFRLLILLNKLNRVRKIWCHRNGF